MLASAAASRSVSDILLRDEAAGPSEGGGAENGAKGGPNGGWCGGGARACCCPSMSAAKTELSPAVLGPGCSCSCSLSASAARLALTSACSRASFSVKPRSTVARGWDPDPGSEVSSSSGLEPGEYGSLSSSAATGGSLAGGGGNFGTAAGGLYGGRARLGKLTSLQQVTVLRGISNLIIHKVHNVERKCNNQGHLHSKIKKHASASF